MYKNNYLVHDAHIKTRTTCVPYQWARCVGMVGGRGKGTKRLVAYLRPRVLYNQQDHDPTLWDLFKNTG